MERANTRDAGLAKQQVQPWPYRRAAKSPRPSAQPWPKPKPKPEPKPEPKPKPKQADNAQRSHGVATRLLREALLVRVRVS